MKRKMLAGLVLLNLCAISLDVTAGEVSISNQEVLDQLVDLRNFIDEKRDFTKQSAKGLKPVAVQYRSSALKVDGIVYCNLSFNTDALHLSIAGYSVQADGTPLSLIINVVYEWTDYVGYTIKSAKINATNTISGASFENIVDENGRKRFIEGDITIEEITGVAQTYGKWSLSGTHLMIVIAGNVENETEITSNALLCNVNLPDWIKNKIVGLFPVGSDEVIDRQTFNIYASSYSAQSINANLIKNSSGDIKIYLSALTLTAKRYFRFEFDLLIDNAPEQAGE